MSAKYFLMALVPLLAAGGAAIGAGSAGPATGNGSSIRCEIEARSSGGMLVLEGVVHAGRPITGSYEFRVSGGGSGGSSNISQGGDFTAGPDGTARLGQVSLGGGRYDADLAVTANGVAVKCSKRVGGSV